MTKSTRHLRPLLISVVALLLTAGIAFAAKPTSVGLGRATGSEASGHIVPTVQVADENAQPDENAEPDEDTEAEKSAEDPADSADHCLADPTKATDEELAAVNHGAVVCGAAHMATPDGYANHGAFVSEWARKNHGADASAKGAAKAAAKAAGHGG